MSAAQAIEAGEGAAHVLGQREEEKRFLIYSVVYW